MKVNQGIILIDCLFGIGIFLSALLFSATELAYFIKISAELNNKNDALLLAVNTLNSIQQKQNPTDKHLHSYEFEPGIQRYEYQSSPYTFTILAER